MHGFIIHGIEIFLRRRHGDDVWAAACAVSGLDRRGTQIMRDYPPETLRQALRAAADILSIGCDELLEDIGGWVPRLENMRHILRFSGSTFEDFVLSLDDLHDRARMVLPGLELPRITTEITGDHSYRLTVTSDSQEWYPVLAGLLRGMADEYGVLAMVDTQDDVLTVSIADDQFAEGGEFSLTQQLGGAA